MSGNDRSKIRNYPCIRRYRTSRRRRALHRRSAQPRCQNRTFLQTAFDWAQHVGTEEDTDVTCKATTCYISAATRKCFLFFRRTNWWACCRSIPLSRLIKRATSAIGSMKRIREGILSCALQAFMRYYVERGEIRRFVIKCRVANQNSNNVARRNGFTRKGACGKRNTSMAVMTM